MSGSNRRRLCLVMVTGFLACSGDSREAPVREAVARFLHGLEQADGSALWDLADRETREAFEDLARQVREGLDLVDRFWPEEEKATTRRAIAGDFAGRQADGRSLFLALLDPRQLNAPADPDSRRIDRIEWSEDRASVVMRSGDTLEFRQDPDGGWRTSVFLEAWRKHPARDTLMRNLQVVRDNARILAEAASEPPKEAP
ncbi:hypothetical protein KBD49_00255 [Myxococcota bacterium]|nr:hypothetical protein [Myxococcota bacterium]